MREDWVEVELDSLTTFVLGGDWGKEPNHSDPDFDLAFCIRGAEFRNWATEFGKTAVLRKLKRESLSKRQLLKNDILVEISGGGPEQPVGRVEIISDTVLRNFRDHPVVPTNFLRLVRLREVHCASYVLNFLKFFYDSGRIRDFQAGSNNLRNLKFNDYLTIQIPLPPLPEQRAIVAKIEALFSSLDKGVAELEKAREQLKVYRQAVLKKAFEGELTKEWRARKDDEVLQWEARPLSQFILAITAGKSFRCVERPPSDNEIGVLKVSAVTWGRFDENESKTVTDNSKINPDYFVQKGDFLISRANTIQLVGRAVIVESVRKKVMLSDKTLRLSLAEELNKRYLLYFLTSAKGREQIEQYSTGNQQSMRNIGQKGIRSIRIPVPLSRHMQDQIVQEIETRFSLCDQLEQSIDESLTKAQALRQSILKKAFAGELLSEAELARCRAAADYEPAAKLLERIKNEKKQK